MSLLGFVSLPSLIALLIIYVYLQGSFLICFSIDAKNFNLVFMFLDMEIVECRQHCSLNRPNDI